MNTASSYLMHIWAILRALRRGLTYGAIVSAVTAPLSFAAFTAAAQSATCAATVAPKDMGYTLKGDTITITRVVPGPTGCTIRLSCDPPYPRCTSNATLSKPSHGTLTAAGPFSWTYVPNPGFHGMDQFRSRLCLAHPAFQPNGAPGCNVVINQLRVD